jgi:hypothetical protein
MKYFLLIPFLFLSVISSSQVTQDTTLLRVETIDGNEYIGKIISIDAQSIVLNTDLLGVITLRKSSIKSMTPVYGSQIKEGVLWFENPQSTRYFWQPNGYGLKKGEAYYQNVWVFFNQVSYGVTDNFLIGAGMVPLFLFGGAPTPVWVTPKFSIPVVKDKLNLGVGGLIGTVIGESQSGFGLVYGTSTVGDRNTNMSLGVGYGYLSGNWANAPVITLSGMLRTGQRGYLLTENYFISTADEDLLIFFVGGRRLIKNAGLDFGLMFPFVSGGSFFAIPWLGLTIPFGNTSYTGIKK